MRTDFGDLLTAVITPFDQSMQVDFVEFRHLVKTLIKQGSDGIVVAGTTGESPTLTREEKLGLFKVAVEEAGEKAQVVAGTCTYSTAESVELSKEAENIGVHGILGTVPYYSKPPQEGLYLHFHAIAEAVGIPLMLYNIPSRTGVNLEPETIARLAEIPNISAIKEASGKSDQVSNIRRLTGDGFEIYSGDDNMTLTILALGGRGVVSVASHIAGSEIRSMIESFQQGDTRRAREIHLKLYPLFKALFVATNPIPLKAALSMLGWKCGNPRLPLCSLSEDKVPALRRTLIDAGYLGAEENQG